MARDTGEQHKVVQEMSRLARHSDAVIVLPCCRIRATVVGSARVMSYEDIVEAQKQRDIKEAAEAARGRRSKRGPSTQALGKRSRGQELDEAEHEIRGSGMAGYCSVLDFK